jgi:hypothetical protein
MDHIAPTPEFVATMTDHQRAARKEVANIAVAFYRMAQTEDGKRVLEYLSKFTSRPVPLEQLPHGAVHKEGQLWLIHEIRTQIAQGEKALASSTS